jgi:glutaredoxin-like protein NrdH
MKVTVYTLPVCVQCNQTKKLMDREGIEYDTVDLQEVPELAAEFKEAGFLQAPVVVVGNDGRRWTGFRPDLIKELA